MSHGRPTKIPYYYTILCNNLHIKPLTQLKNHKHVIRDVINFCLLLRVGRIVLTKQQEYIEIHNETVEYAGQFENPANHQSVFRSRDTSSD